ncbi:MAG: lytic transglycosylase F [Rhodospirillales bacterium]|nr:MAG: lytic transglycosylase F [Rhodospirillales bacterium]
MDERPGPRQGREQLGEALVVRSKEVSHAERRRRPRAPAVGSLETNAAQAGIVAHGAVTMAPANPAVVHVPADAPVVVDTTPPMAPPLAGARLPGQTATPFMPNLCRPMNLLLSTSRLPASLTVVCALICGILVFGKYRRLDSEAIRMLAWLFPVVLAIAVAVAAAPGGADSAAAVDEEDALLAALADPWTGDLDGIVERGYLRTGVPYGPAFLTYDGAAQEGISVDLAREFEKHLRAALGKQARTLTVAIIPLPRDQMFGSLLAGRIDVLAANLTITPERAENVAFSQPMLKGVKELVVTGPSAPTVQSLDDLAQTALHVRPSSSYHEHLTALNAAREAAGQPPIPVIAANENLEDFDLFELLEVGVIPGLVVDSHKASIYAQLFPKATVHEDLVIHEGGEIAWAVRPDSPQLMAAVNGFAAKAKKGTELGNILFRRWLVDPTRIRNAVAGGEDKKFTETIDYIRAHASTYDFDPMLIAAQGYQESGLDQTKRSAAGAVGIMQVMPKTARDPVVGIPDIHISNRNVEAGVKYLRFIRDHYFAEPTMSELDQTLFAFAAYNAGPGNVAKARRRAEAMGLDPNVWFGNVEIAAARVIGREPVVYVRNILKYYVTFRLYEDRLAAG